MSEVKSIGIVVSSCDRYSDLWAPFFALFNRFWPDCPYPRFLVTETIQQNSQDFGCKMVLGGKGVPWSTCILNALKQIECDYVLLLVDDLFLHSPIDQAKVKKIFDWAAESGANCVKMNKGEGPDLPINVAGMENILGIASPGTLYRASTVFSFWKKDALIALLEPKESIWDFEVFATERSDGMPGFYACYETTFPNHNGVIKGLWRPSAVRELKKLGITPDLHYRREMSLRESLLFQLILLRHKAFRLFPPQSKRMLKRFFLRGKYSYRMEQFSQNQKRGA